MLFPSEAFSDPSSGATLQIAFMPVLMDGFITRPEDYPRRRTFDDAISTIPMTQITIPTEVVLSPKILPLIRIAASARARMNPIPN
jgi:hypothetical protein